MTRRQPFFSVFILTPGILCVLMACASGPPESDLAHYNSGYGTCFLVGPNGSVITSHHVVKAAESITVELADGRELSAEVEKFSAENDISVLRVAGETPRYLSFAPSDTVHVGDSVFTVGFPLKPVFGFGAVFTDGSISALSGVHEEARYMQISVPIQPGNSGGPIVNNDGEVVGVVAASTGIISFYRVSGSLPQNVNWAVKSDYVRTMIDEVPARIRVSSRRKAISRVQNAVCRVTTSR